MVGSDLVCAPQLPPKVFLGLLVCGWGLVLLGGIINLLVIRWHSQRIDLALDRLTKISQQLDEASDKFGDEARKYVQRWAP